MPATEYQTATTLSTQDRAALIGMAQWARLLSIVGFVSITLLVLGSLLTYVALEQFAPALDSLSEEQRQLIEEAYAEGATDGTTAEALMQQQMASTRLLTGVAVFLLLLLAAIYMVPTLLLYRFSVRVREALDGSFNAALFSSALQAHRRMYKFMGILTLGLFVLYMFFFLGSALLGAALQNYGPVGG